MSRVTCDPTGQVQAIGILQGKHCLFLQKQSGSLSVWMSLQQGQPPGWTAAAIPTPTRCPAPILCSHSLRVQAESAPLAPLLQLQHRQHSVGRV